jgi:hypothetical protein
MRINGTALRWLALAMIPVTAVAAVIVNGGPAQASASPTAQICSAAAAVHAHPALADENAMMNAVIRNPWVKYLSEDATGYYADARGLPGAKYFAKDWSYLVEDGC